MKNRTILHLAGLLCTLSLPVEGSSKDPDVIAKMIPDSDLNISLLDISTAPSSIVGGSVNVITGSYIESECDIVIPGSNPICIQRNFNSGNKKRGTLCHGWDLNFPSDIKFTYQKNIKKPITAIVNDRGADLVFKGRSPKDIKLSNRQLHFGVTNCSAGILSSRTNMRNKELSLHIYEAKHCELHEESGEILFYKRSTPSSSKDGLTYSVSKNLFPNGCSILYEYDRKKRLSDITLTGQGGNPINHIKWLYPADFKSTPKLTLVSSDGRKVCYKYQKQESYDEDDKHRYCLTSVRKEHGPEMSYEYRYASQHSMERMIKKSLPENRYLSVEYYEEGKNKVGVDSVYISNRKDARVGRVSALYAPVGLDASPIMTWSFKYDLEKSHRSNKPIAGCTEVTDALGHRKIYSFSDEHRLTSVEHFLDNNQLYRNEILDWEESGDEKTFLMSRGFTDGNGFLLLRRDYSYDERGNALKEILSGNLSGCGNETAKWDSHKKAEKHETTYTYTSTGLLATENDGRKKIVYQYLAGKDLLAMKLIYDRNTIRERHHYTYDSNSTLIKEILDDGNSQNIDDLSGVTERHIKKIYPTLVQPIGLPEVTEDWFLNLATGQEELLTRSKNKYSKEGYLLLQKIYDSKNKYCYSKEWVYDLHGNVIQEKDPLGQITTFQYDQNKNRIYQQTPNLQFYTLYSYDYANRLTREERVFNDGKKRPYLVNSYSYDYMGNKIASTDKHNQTIECEYDEFGRLIKKIYPLILDIKGKLKRPVDTVRYDCMNNPRLKTDTNGHKTEIKHTVHGKPYQIINPDGTMEHSIYHLDGILKKSVDIKGVETFYTYDYKGRKTKEKKISPNGELLLQRQWIYSTFHLMEEIDPAGYRTFYSYDGAGRKKSVQKGDSKIKYVYDSLGRLSETREIYGSGKCHKTVLEHDYLNRVIRETVMDEHDTVFAKKSFKYDESGNRTHVIIHDNSSTSCTETVYDFDKRPIKIIQPDGSQTLFEYIDDFKNDLGQTVAFKKEIDPKGNQTIQIMDACGRLAKEEKRDILDILLQRTLYFHDGEGNLVKRKDDVLMDGVVKKNIKIEFQFDSKNREIAVIEAAGSPLQKITCKEYHPSGELAKIIKPDGVIINHEYDCLGRLIKMHSSDGSIHYIHEYDQNDNIIKVEDVVHGITTSRTIDDNNRMVSEQQGTGLQFTYQYDRRGRVKKLVLPDMSTVEYAYDAVNLRTIKRKTNRNSFSCKYDFNLSGRIANIELPNNLGNVKFSYDKCLRTKSIESKNWSQSIPKGGYDLCGNLIKVHQQDAVGKLSSSYTYDALHHLISETGVADNSYKFDSLHNRTNKNGIRHDVNALNQLTQQGKVIYEYDLNGNQIKKTCSNKTTIYQYDALDRLTAVNKEDMKVEYLYDSFHRRLKKSIFAMQNKSWTETEAFTYLYQGDKEIGALDSRGQVIEMRTLGLGNNGEIGAAVFLEFKGVAMCPLHDFRGNVAALVNLKDGNVIESYRYTAYGEEQIFDSSGNMQNTALCPWRFSSKRIDPETGWIFFGRRYYDSEVGKWITPDPLRFIDGPNVYCFVHNRPMKYLDPDGRWLSELIGDNYEKTVNSIRASAMKEYGGVEWDAFQAPNYFYYSTKYKVGTPRNDGIGMTFVNGIGNSKKDSEKAAGMYSKMAGGREVLGVHNASYGIGFDLIESGLGLFGVETTPSKLIKENWDECRANNNKHILHLAHSQGMIHTRNTIPSYDEELRKNINVIAVAPAAHVKEDDFRKTIHFESKRDFVPLFDKLLKIVSLDFDAIKNCAPIVMLDPHPEAPFLDHCNDSKTYERPVRDSIQAFTATYGALQ